MSVDESRMLVRRARDLMLQDRRADAEILLIEAWRLARNADDAAQRGDIAFRIAAIYRIGGQFEQAREFDSEAMRFQRVAFGLT